MSILTTNGLLRYVNTILKQIMELVHVCVCTVYCCCCYCVTFLHQLQLPNAQPICQLNFVSHFWKWSQNALKTIFDVFCQFFGLTLKCNFLSHLLMLFCEVVGAQRAPNEGPKCPPMPSAGAIKKGP